MSHGKEEWKRAGGIVVKGCEKKQGVQHGAIIKSSISGWTWW